MSMLSAGLSAGGADDCCARAGRARSRARKSQRRRIMIPPSKGRGTVTESPAAPSRVVESYTAAPASTSYPLVQSPRTEADVTAGGRHFRAWDLGPGGRSDFHGLESSTGGGP